MLTKLAILFTLSASALAENAVGLDYGSPLVAPSGAATRMHKMTKRDDDWASLDHCPGGSIGDADACTFEPDTIYTTPLKRWRQYGAWFDNCGESNTAAITQTVSDSVAIGNSFTSTTEISVGFELEGFSAGVSQSFSESWSTTTTFTQQQAITVEPHQAGNINVAKNFFLTSGHIRINYGDRKDGHYIWLHNGIDVYTVDPSSSDVYSANVADCGVISQPSRDALYYWNADYDKVKAGPSESHTYTYRRD